MLTPRVDINLQKIAHNVKTLKALYSSKGISIIGVTKVVCGNPDIAKILVKSGIEILGDSRIINIRRMRDAGIKAQFLLLRTPFLSQAKAVIRYTDISLNTELIVIKRLSEIALKNKKIHKIILMVELGDLREGIMPPDIDDFIEKILLLKGIELVGIGTNMACFGGIKPDEEKMNHLSSLARSIEIKFDIKLKFVSGGNSSNYSWFISTKKIGRINNVRLGESIYLGRETLQRKPMPHLFTDAFTLVTEVIESKIKPSKPYGECGSQDAFGNIPEFHDRGHMRRVLLGIGLQDVMVSGLTPKMDISILGSSSDHIIINAKKISLKVGDKVGFNLNYGALLSIMTSQYVYKNMTHLMNASDYCQLVEQKEIQVEALYPSITTMENNSPLVNLEDSGFNLIFESSIKRDYKFLVREAVFEKIGRISKILDKEFKVLIIRSVWRSFEHQKLLWDNRVNFLQKINPEKTLKEIHKSTRQFIAEETKSMHTTGGAVDALIYDLKNDCVMDFGTNKGLKIELNKRCYPFHPDITSKAMKNRKLLIDLFEDEDFVCDLKEYWHFNYGNINWAAQKGKKYSIYGII